MQRIVVGRTPDGTRERHLAVERDERTGELRIWIGAPDSPNGQEIRLTNSKELLDALAALGVSSSTV